MFGIQSVPSQVVVPLGQMTSALSTGIRTMTQQVLASRTYTPSQTNKISRGTSECLQTPTVDITDEILHTVKEFGFENLPRGIRFEAISPPLQPEPPSELPHTSSQSFFQNKNGFTEKQLWQCTFGDTEIDALKVTIPRTQVGLLRKWSQNIMHQQTRGFKTRRSRATGLGKTSHSVDLSDESPYATSKNIKDSVLDKITMSSRSRSSDKLKTMISEESNNPAMQDKIKVAFAEGYSAHERNPTFWRRMIRGLTYLCLGLCAFQFFKLYTAIGDNMKGLNVLKSDRYEVNPEEITITFADVKGVDEAKQELQDVVEFLRNPEKFKRLGAKLPKGVLLVGPPGIGKTLLARAVAGESGVPFFHASGSEFDEIFVGTGAKRVRQLFDAAKTRGPCVIFIDEIDTVGAKRTSSQIHPYANQTINQLLSEMDGFEQNDGVIVLGATNRIDNLDKALLRPGRFDVEVRVFPPDLKGRKEIIGLYLTKLKYDRSLDIEKLARGTTGFTGADLENMVNQAALKAAMDCADLVTIEHLEFARDKVIMGPAKKSKIQDEETNHTTAVHEAGHTIVAYYTKDAKPLHKVTIIPRGQSLGHTSMLPEKDEYHMSRSQLLAQLDVSMGGRVAEELLLGTDKVTTGASSDFSMATGIATAMVKRFGMSDKVGVRVFGNEDPYDTGISMFKVNECSPALTETVDNEIKRILQESYERARTILKSRAKEHKELTEALLKYETLDDEDIKNVIEGKRLKIKKML